MNNPSVKYLHYHKFGSGPKNLLAFHGFGQDHSVFLPFKNTLGKEYTILSFDLFFHGQSHWPEKEIPVPPEAWKQMLLEILNKEKISKFSMIGYSYGGKIAIATAHLMPEKVEKLYLAATDGIHYNFWFRFATGTAPVRALFLYLCKNPKPFIRLVKFAAKTGLISKNLGRFVVVQLGVKADRKRLYLTWVGYRKFTLNQRSILKMLNQHEIKLELISGKYDSVIPYKELKIFTEKVHSSRFHLINTGHQSLLKKFNEELNKSVSL